MRVIHAIGVDSDRTLVHFVAQAERFGVLVRPINLRAIAKSGKWRLAIPDDGYSFVTDGEEYIPLDPSSSFFCRLIDLSSVQRDKEGAGLWRNLINGLISWLEHIPGRVINRPGAHAHNFSKPLHEEFLCRSGFTVPKSLTSSNKQELLNFAHNSKVIIKTISGIRANSEVLDIERLEKEFAECRGPIHLQNFVPGGDIRAHVVADTVHSELICGDTADYRASRALSFCAHLLPMELENRVINATKDMGLSFAGWDFKLDANGTYWCLEANPMPGYDGYDRRLGGQITESLLQNLIHA
jgi:hypothetical protein